MFKNRIVQWLLVGVFMLPIAAHMLAGQNTRLLADDYCFGNIALTQGWWGAMTHWYTQWQGTFSSTGMQSFAALLGPQFIRCLPPLFLLLWWIGSFWAAYEFGLITKIKNPLFAAVFMASLLVFATTASLPNIFQAVYWTSGSVTYVTPLILMMFYIGFALRSYRTAKTTIISVIFSPLMTFLAGGFSPVFAVLQITLLGLSILAVWIFLPTQRKSFLPLLVAGLIGAGVALLVMLIAPGNAIRQAKFPPSPNLPTLILMNLQFTLSFIAIGIATFSPLAILTALLFSALLPNGLQPLTSSQQAFFKRHSRRLLAISGAIGFVVFFALFLPSTYSVSAFLPARALVIPQLVLIVLVVFWGGIMGLSLQKPNQRDSMADSKLVVALAAILLLIVPIRATLNTLNVAGNLRTFAAEWDARDREIRAALARGETRVESPRFTVDLARYVDVATLTETPNTGVNACVENYYGLDAFSVQ